MKTSVIVTCHNYGRYLKQCLDSILRQTKPFREIILIDDASTDETFDVWKSSYLDQVRYERVELRNRMAVRHYGVERATGEFIVCVDADDWLSPNFHQLMVKPLQADPSVGFSYCGLYLIPENGSHLYRADEHVMREFDPYRLWQSNDISQTCLIRRAAWRGNQRAYGVLMSNGRQYGEDWDHIMDIVCHGWKGELVREKLIFKKMHGESSSLEVEKDIEKFRESRWQIKERFLQYDLSIVCFFSGRDQTDWRGLRENIGGLDVPVKTQILFVDGCGQDELRQSCETAGITYLPIPYVRQVSTDDGWKQAALWRVRRYVAGGEVLLLDEDMRLGADAYTRLSEVMKSKRASFCSVRVPLGWGDGIAAWRALRGVPDRGIYFTPVARAPKRVFATALKAVLINARAFHDMPLECGRFTEGSTPVTDKAEPLEFICARQAWESGYRWFVDGRIHAARLDRAGMKVRPGRDGRFNFGANGKVEAQLPGVSIVIPVRDGGRTIRALLQSLRTLDYPHEKFETLVVDNGSSDDTLKIVREFPEVKLKFEKTPSSYAARNTGLRESRFGIIAFLDADTEVTAQWLRELVKPFAESERVGAVGGGNIPRGGIGDFPELERKQCGYRNWVSPVAGSRLSYVITMNAAYRRAVFKDVGPFDDREISGSDVDMSWRMQTEGRWELRVLDEQAMVYHKDPDTLLGLVRRAVRIGRGHYGLYQKHPLSLPLQYTWLPRTRCELILRLLKRAAFKNSDTRLGLNPRLTTRDRVFFLLRDFFNVWGYSHEARLRARKRVTGAAKQRKYLLCSGKDALRPQHPVFRDLWIKSCSGFRVLHEGPSRSCLRSWYEAILSAAGGTTVWTWRPGFQSLFAWKLLPEFGRWRWPQRINDAINRARIRRVMGVPRGGQLTVRSNPDAIQMREWEAAWRRKRIAVRFQEQYCSDNCMLLRQSRRPDDLGGVVSLAELAVGR
ncbi:MAG: glycosyltransferase family 2 protein [Candidatus Omnitrophota bacterium]|nr:glycosyltransferase family 2 protein [Candidatus Omnitrophota bacterium]